MDVKLSKKGWVKWARHYGLEPLCEALVRNCQGAKSKCQYCGQDIFFDILEGCGVPDWRTQDGDYGCLLSPETVLSGPDAGCGGHMPVKLLKEG